MKKFIVQILLIIGIAVFIEAIPIFVIPKDNNQYLCEYNEKIKLLENTPQPRIIIVAGSNVAFGIDSKRIADSLKKNVINFGLHAGLQRFIYDDLKQYVQPGDIIVMQMEYGLLCGNGNGETETLSNLMIATDWHNVSSLTLGQWESVLSGLPRNAFGNVKRLAKVVLHRQPTFDKPEATEVCDYCKSGFNEFGDEVSHWTLKSHTTKYPKPTPKSSKINPKMVEWLTETINSYEQSGGKVVMLPPVCIKSHLEALSSVAVTDSTLSKIGHPYLATPEFMSVDDSCFFDTGYHVNKAGVDQNTGKIIGILRGFGL